jgi:hypothetical protein
MSGYLDQYGAGEEQRNKLIIRSVVAVVVIAAAGALGWYLLKNHHQESVVKPLWTICAKAITRRLIANGAARRRSRAPHTPSTIS